MKRRNFLGLLPAAAIWSAFNPAEQLPISCSTYDWLTFYSREGKKWGENVDADIADFKKTGMKAIEPNLTSLEMTKSLIAALKRQNIRMPSVYVNSTLHEARTVSQEIEKVLKIARLAKSYGTSIVVTNPSPISWGEGQLKSDRQLSVQAKALNDLGTALRQLGMHLAYHTHDMEMKAGAREFHHMLQNTEPQNMSFCFDVHWIYRGSGNSALAVYDVLKMYGNRVIELHLRQSKAGLYEEVFSGDGDIDYHFVASELQKQKVRAHLVIEQCLEQNSPHTLNAVEAHKQDFEVVKKVFKRDF
ncbi:sugar phosphate isomerase/epimerase [Marinilongibacter aquaticus]|uniref:sugar phosphate isomerase/epimerase family protein n=1 Tax=Marinilongibacter aquaticus TaxID=2975157 RepID=UPI0021BD2918|nr:sugar phosphate isomerase/epimerase [Marinilongibacter aquaticus]UBM58437.1 sugar phosphate isomerase/epimerase [Marinilongibacter aquaticus]